nr:hypothetical protein [Rhodoferax sp.]
MEHLVTKIGAGSGRGIEVAVIPPPGSRLSVACATSDTNFMPCHARRLCAGAPIPHRVTGHGGERDRASSVRDMSGNAPTPAADYHRRNNERLCEAQVTSVRAVVDTPEQRCWVERGHVVQDRSSSTAPGAIADAIIGGILGHQVSGGTGKYLATISGAVAGAAVGARVGRDGREQQAFTQDVQRYETVPRQAKPQFVWSHPVTRRPGIVGPDQRCIPRELGSCCAAELGAGL